MSLRELFKHTIIYGLAYTLSRFFLVLLIPVYTRILPQSEYGALELLVTAVDITILVLNLQINSGTMRFFYDAQARGEEHLLVSTSFWTLWILPMAGVIGIILFSDNIAALLNITGHKEWLILASLTIPFNIQFYHNMLVFQLLNIPWVYLLFNVSQVVVTTALILLFVIIFHLGIAGVFLGDLIGLAVFFVLSTYKLRNLVTFRFSKRYLTEVLKYSIPLGPAVWSNWFQNSANRFIIASFLGLAKVGVFSLSFRIANIILFVQYSFRLAWSPQAMKTIGKEGSEEYYARVFNIFILIMACVATVITLFGDILTRFFAPQEYYEAVKYIGFMTMGIILTGLNMFFALGNNIVKKTYWNTSGFVVGSVINLGGLYLTIERIGLASAPVWFVVGGIIANLIILFVSQKHHKIPYSYFRYFLFVLFLASLSLWRLYQPLMPMNYLNVIKQLAAASVIIVFLLILHFGSEYFKTKSV